MGKKKILFIYDYFFPGYKAGGPIQSLTNLILNQQLKNEIFVITSGYDMKSSDPYPHIKLNAWNKCFLPGSAQQTDIWYSDAKGPNRRILKVLIKEINPEYIYLNGIFSFKYFLSPLLASSKTSSSHKVVICPRGMLQKGALDGKSAKKKIYLAILRFSGLVKNAKWHATNNEEREDIRSHFPGATEVIIAENIPKKPIEMIAFPLKIQGEISLIYLSLIAEKKNLLLLLQAINQVKAGISLKIYGPPKDIDYWHQCEKLINAMPEKVTYMGDVQPENVQQVLATAQVFILPTKGENFGHAIYESLSVGRPVITSFFTPWNDLEQKIAGVNIDISNNESIVKGIERFINMDQREYNSYCVGAYKIASNYFEEMDSDSKYQKLFL